MVSLNLIVEETIEAIRSRSRKTRKNYLDRLEQMETDPDGNRGMIGCSNLAHAAAGMVDESSEILSGQNQMSRLLPLTMTCCRPINHLKKLHQF